MHLGTWLFPVVEDRLRYLSAATHAMALACTLAQARSEVSGDVRFADEMFMHAHIV